MSRLVIVGASGHGKVLADIAVKLKKYDEIVFLDDNSEITELMGFSVIGRAKTLDNVNPQDEVIVGIGNSAIRRKIQEQVKNSCYRLATLIHPHAVIGMDVSLGEGSVIMAGAVINSGASIGCGNIINTTASVDHDCQIEDYVHISIGAHVAGTVKIGSNTWIGAGAIINNNLSICDDVMIGSGAVVVKDIVEKGTYVGVPARRTD